MPYGKQAYIWDGTQWVSIVPYESYVTSRWKKTASGGETSLSGNDDNSIPLSYDVNFEQVYLNGVLLARNGDYTAADGASITGLTALSSGDIVEVITFNMANLANTYTTSVADGKFLSQTSASTTYLTQSSASINYLTQSSASTNYASKNDISQVEAIALLAL